MTLRSLPAGGKRLGAVSMSIGALGTRPKEEEQEGRFKIKEEDEEGLGQGTQDTVRYSLVEQALEEFIGV